MCIYYTELTGAFFVRSYRRALEVEEGHVAVMSNYAYLMLGGQKLSSRETISAQPQASI